MLLIFKIFLAAVVVLTLFVVLSQLLEFLFVCFFPPLLSSCCWKRIRRGGGL